MMPSRGLRLLKKALCALALCVALWLACSGANKPRFIRTNELAARVDLSELTPMEAKRFEQIVNGEVSPCGDDVTLAESLYNTERCPLAGLASRFVAEQIMEDYSAEEISKAYLARYAAVKGLDVPVDGSPATSAQNPLVTIVIFSDFECPFCAKAAEKLHDLTRRDPDRLKVVYKHFPISSHPVAEYAARAAYAAQLQGKFWEMHDTLFSAIGSELTRDRIDVMAEGLGLEMKKWREDLSSPAATGALDADRQLAKRLGVEGTPTILVNGRKLNEGIGKIDERLYEELLRYDRK